MNEKFFEQFTQHRCYTINQDFSTCGSSSAEQLSRILAPLTGHTEHTVKTSTAFTERIRGFQLAPEDQLVSFDVTSLFTQVSINEALTVGSERTAEQGSDLEWENQHPHQPTSRTRGTVPSNHILPVSRQLLEPTESQHPVHHWKGERESASLSGRLGYPTSRQDIYLSVPEANKHWPLHPFQLPPSCPHRGYKVHERQGPPGVWWRSQTAGATPLAESVHSQRVPHKASEVKPLHTPTPLPSQPPKRHL